MYGLPTDAEYLSKVAWDGFNERFPVGTEENSSSEYIERLEFELDTIRKMGFPDYFLIVWDFVLYSKKNGILVGPGRGSSAGALVSYCLGIVDIDPIEYNLLFERFLNPERITMPDIDLDFPDNKRDEVIRYVKEKYGKFNTVNIAAFGTFQAKSALRDVARVLEIDDYILNDLGKRIVFDNSLQSLKGKNKNLYEGYRNKRRYGYIR